MGLESASELPVEPELSPPASADQSDEAMRFWNDLKTVPNVLSIFRIFGILVAAMLYLYGHRKAGIILGTIAGITDILDGWLARKLDQSTELGAILDRLSDLIMETMAFAWLLYFQLLSPVFYMVYLVREFVVMSARLYAAERGASIETSYLGKFKTDFIAGSFVCFFLVHSGLVSNENTADVVYKVGYFGMVTGLLMSYASGLQYLQSFMRIYSRKK
jgi:CDP-diacylglycerol--glycerol-3-phosphate 3-phosphatidyltransferase